MKVHTSALKHNITKEQIFHAITYHVILLELNEIHKPYKVLFIGHDQNGRLLEVVATATQDGELLVIHAMKARKKYIALTRWKGVT